MSQSQSFSGSTPPPRSSLDVEEQIARIQRSNAELSKLVEESYKLNAEARKLRRDAWLGPIATMVSTGTSVLALIGAATALIKAFY